MLGFVNTSETSHVPKMLDIVGICVINNFNETKKLYAFLNRPYIIVYIEKLSDIIVLETCEVYSTKRLI